MGSSSSFVSFTADKAPLESAARWVASNLPARPAHPILASMVFVAQDNVLRLMGYDYDVSTDIAVSADIHSEGRFGIAGGLVFKILSKLPNLPVKITEEEGQVRIQCGSSLFEVPKVSLDDYPMLPAMPAVSGSIDPVTFTTAVGKVAPSASKNVTGDALSALLNIHIKVEGDQLRLAATDRFRLATCSIPWQSASYGTGGAILVSAASLSNFAKAVDLSSADPVSLYFGDTSIPDEVENANLVGLQTDQRKTTIRLAADSYPEYQKLLPSSFRTATTVSIEDLMGAAQRVTIMSNHQMPKVILEIGEDAMVIRSVNNDGHGDAEETIPCSSVGEPLIIGLQTPYLLDGLKAVSSPTAALCFNGATSAAIIRESGEDSPIRVTDGEITCDEGNFTYLVMPVHI